MTRIDFSFSFRLFIARSATDDSKQAGNQNKCHLIPVDNLIMFTFTWNVFVVGRERISQLAITKIICETATALKVCRQWLFNLFLGNFSLSIFAWNWALKLHNSMWLAMATLTLAPFFNEEPASKADRVKKLILISVKGQVFFEFFFWGFSVSLTHVKVFRLFLLTTSVILSQLEIWKNS